jgi:hypothetical protein
LTRDEIIETLIQYLDQQLERVRGHTAQPSCKADFFKLFKEAYANGYFEGSPSLEADFIRKTLLTRWSSIRDGQEEQKSKLIEEWSARWEEWRYAFQNYS